ncbi:Aste57867_12621 [Aphanomyces stellatus]|uniref:Aste57867_12621 protein n=1 Tax=Aphanomyces stellatus TaxID=120398 RepID=A0A485KWH2_9STRA|nr:hypothetical protein As57867_012575 [Aphanomyces stellatus]VFT89471.1 Aste57867_12621 [Aphanomyces stellatus]
MASAPPIESRRRRNSASPRENAPLFRHYDTFSPSSSSSGASPMRPRREIPLMNIVVDKQPSAEEKWTDAGKLPTFTVEDAQKMEWDYANIVREVRKHSAHDFTEFDHDADEDLAVLLDPFYDVTTGRLKRMFHHFAPHGASSSFSSFSSILLSFSICILSIFVVGEDKVSYEAFEKGLTALGITPPVGESIDDFMRKIDADHDGCISLDEFIHVVQMVKQAHLFRPEHEADAYSSTALLRVVDYSPTTLHATSPVKKLMPFMFSATPAWAKVRWVHVAGFKRTDDINLRRLAIKYQLHPLALEDCLNQDGVVRCKYEHYEDHKFLCLPLLRPLDKQKKSDLEGYINRHRYDMFAKDRSLGDKARSISDMSYEKARAEGKRQKKLDLEAKLDNLRIIMRKPQQLCIFIAKDDTVLSVQEESDVGDNTNFPLWTLVFRQHMSKSYSKIRTHDAMFLVVSILNAVVDETMPLVQVFESKLRMMGKLLRIEGTKFNIKRLARAKKNLIAIEKIVRPLLDLVDGQLMDHAEFTTGEVKNYLRDVKDHLKQMANDIKEHQQVLAELVDEDKQIRQQHKDDVLYIMTISATLFLPGTFMTGLYGMNFDNMPELHTEYGYFVWWAVFFAILVGLFSYLKHKQWI